MTQAAPLTGRKVFAITAAGFSIIIAVNLTLAFQAVATFPGLETRNSYVASQTFEADRDAQLALGWEVSATATDDGLLRLEILRQGRPVTPVIRSAILGRATHVGQDQTPRFTFDGRAHVAQVALAEGNWNLRLVAEAEDGTLFRQRIVVRTPR